MAKLDKIAFAKLIGFCAANGMSVGDYEIEQLDTLAEIQVPEPPMMNPETLHVLMALMQEGTRKIEAIKQHRMMTGYGLKESKDIIDKYWPENKVGIIKERLLKNVNDLSYKSLDDRQINEVFKYIEANIY